MEQENSQFSEQKKSQQITHGTPVNTKSLLAFIFDQMAKLNENLIPVETAKAQAALAGKAVGLLNYELKRTLVQETLRQAGQNVLPHIREIESKPFDDTI